MGIADLEKFQLNKLGAGDDIPFELLLLADETKEAIERYIHQSEVYILFTVDDVQMLGVFALYKVDEDIVEIKNIAVLESHRSLGIGRFLIGQIKQIAIARNYKEVIVGTGDCGAREIAFYEKNGFERYGVRANFFVENYVQPIIENGCMLKDMVMLRYIL